MQPFSHRSLAVFTAFVGFTSWMTTTNLDASTGTGAGANPRSAGSGELFARTSQGYVPMPIVHTDVAVQVTGLMIHGTVEQTFLNSSGLVIEALYVFPLPENSAVHHMEIQIGRRKIVSIIQERQQAKRTYTAAKTSGRKAALLEQERPNLFTTSIANINPGESVKVVLEYIEEADYDNGTYHLAVPLTFTPRFTPAARLKLNEATGKPVIASTQVPDAKRVTPPFQSSSSFHVPTASFRAQIDMGLPLANVSSPSHDLQVRRTGESVIIEPRGNYVQADRDLILEWTIQLDRSPKATLLAETIDDATYALFMLIPPELDGQLEVGLATETLFILDISGSMAGPSIRQAKAALNFAISQLQPTDRFNIMTFNHTQQFFQRAFLPGDAFNKDRAQRWMRSVHADGGTEILPALFAGLDLFAASDVPRVQRIVFLTDGAVSNETQVLASVVRSLGNVRLHTLGIGYAPNRYLMRQMAAAGHGMCEFISESPGVENRISNFLERLQRPVLTNVTLEWTGVDVHSIYPRILPDLHAGEPLYISTRLDGSTRDLSVTLRAQSSKGTVSQRYSPTRSGDAAGIEKRWARAHVGDLTNSIRRGANADSVRQAIIDVGLQHHLVTRFTSLVAVEEKPSAEGKSHSARVANSLPSGSQLLNAGLPQGGTSRPLVRRLGLLLLVLGLIFALTYVTTRRAAP